MKALSPAAMTGLFVLLAACGDNAAKDANGAAGGAARTSANADAASGTMANMAMSAATKTASGSGTVKALDTAAGTITLAHGPIPEAGWPAMTMTFKAAPGVLADVKPGDKVAFNLALANGSGEVTAIRKQ